MEEDHLRGGAFEVWLKTVLVFLVSVFFVLVGRFRCFVLYLFFLFLGTLLLIARAG